MKWSRCLWRKMTTIFRLFSSSCNANFKTSFWNFPFISFEYIVVGLVFELVEFNGKPPILHSIKIEISRKKHGNVSVISLKNIAKCHGFDCCQYAMIDFDLSNIKIAILSGFFHQFSMNDSIAHLIRSLAFVSFLPFFTSFFSSIDIW